MAISKSTRILIAQAGVFLVIISVVLYIINSPKDTLAGLVPEHASWFIEVDKPMDVLKGVQRGLRLFSDPNLTVFAEWQSELEFTQRLLAKEPKINQYLKSSCLGISAHVITGKEPGYIFYMPVPNSEQENLFKYLKDYYLHSQEGRVTEREYLNKRIFEIELKGKKTTFSIASIDGALAGSFSGFLVEEVVRKSGLIFKPNFVTKIKKDVRFASLATNPVRLFLNLKNLPDFIHKYLSKSLNGISLLPLFGNSLAIGFKAPNGLNWESDGYMLIEDPKEKDVHQTPLNEKLYSYIPENKAIAFQFLLSDLWTSLQDKNETISGADSDTISNCLENEILISMVEGEGLKKYNRLFVAVVKNPDLFEKWIQVQEKKGTADRKYKETIDGTDLIYCTNGSIGRKLGGSYFADWQPLFYYRHQEFLVFSDDLNALKRSLEVASKPMKIAESKRVEARFIDFKLFVSSVIPLFLESSTGPFKANFSEWLPILRSLNSVSFSDNGEGESPSVKFKVNWKLPSSLASNWVEKGRILLDTDLISRPIRIEAREENDHFWLVQDRRFQTYLLKKNLEPKVKIKQGSKWISSPQIINTKDKSGFSLFLPTKGAIYLEDQKGLHSPGFPVLLPDSNSTIEHASAIDYDNSTQYRFFIASRYGSVFATDLKGKFLEGWNPWKHEIPMSIAPQHVRIGDKDVIVLLDQMGNLILTNRKGEVLPGFPLKLENRTNQPVFIENGLDFKTSYIYVLSELGQVEKINFQGIVSSSQQLFRPSKNTRFQFCMDQKKKTFVVVRISEDKIVIFDQSYRQIFENGIKSSDIEVQYFHFGASNKIFALTDFYTKTCSLFNEAGESLNHPVLEVTQPVDIVRKSKDGTGFLILLGNGPRLSLLEFEKD